MEFTTASHVYLTVLKNPDTDKLTLGYGGEFLQFFPDYYTIRNGNRLSIFPHKGYKVIELVLDEETESESSDEG
jgi:hypothetical protein